MKTRWAFIGAGGIARSVAKRIFGSDRHELVAVYNRTAEKAQKLADAFGGRVFDNLERAITESDADAVYINVTNDRHYEFCMRALACGKPVLMEKPFTTDAEQAQKLFYTAAQNGTYLCEAMWTWFSAQAAELKNIVQSGVLGKPKGGYIAFCLPIAFSKNNRLLQSNKAGGALLDLGVYPLTYAYRLFGKPTGMDCSAKFRLGVDTSDDITLKYDGFDIIVKNSITSLRGVGEKLKLEFENGVIVSNGYHSGGGFKVRGAVKKSMRRDKNAMLTQFDRVAEEIKAGKTTSEFVTPRNSLDVMNILDEVRSKIGLKFGFEK